MRLLKHIAHPSYGISLYQVNDKFVLKVEKDGCEVSFKMGEEAVQNAQALEDIIFRPDFLPLMDQQFHSLFLVFDQFFSG